MIIKDENKSWIAALRARSFVRDVVRALGGNEQAAEALECEVFFGGDLAEALLDRVGGIRSVLRMIEAGRDRATADMSEHGQGSVSVCDDVTKLTAERDRERALHARTFDAEAPGAPT